MGACMCVFETHQKVVCLGLVDGNARTIEARRDGGLHMCLETHQKLVLSRPAGWERKGDQGGMDLQMYSETHQKVVCLGLLDGNPWAIKAGWGLAYVS